MIRQLRALIKKETLQIFKDPSSLLISIFLPILLLFLYGYGISLDIKHLHVGLVMEDTSPEARDLAQSLTDSPYFDVIIARDRREASTFIDEGKIKGFVVIPAYYTSFLNNPNLIAPIQVITDGSEPNTANFVQGYVQQALAAQMGTPQVQIVPRFWYNEELQSRFFLLSGSVATIMTLIGTLLTALVVSREWERGTMEALISTPVSKYAILTGKLIPYFLLGMISVALCVFVSTVFYGLPLRGSLLILAVESAVFLLCALGVGILISTLAKVQIISSQIAIVVGFMPAYILSGFLFEISSMPSWVKALTYFVPARYFVQSLQSLFLVGNVWPLILQNMAAMLLMALVLFTLTILKMKKRLD